MSFLGRCNIEASRASPAQKLRGLRVFYAKNISRATFFVFWVTQLVDVFELFARETNLKKNRSVRSWSIPQRDKTNISVGICSRYCCICECSTIRRLLRAAEGVQETLRGIAHTALFLVFEIYMIWTEIYRRWKHSTKGGSILKTDRKRILLLNNCYMTVSGHFFVICMLFFHKTEVQTFILICSTGLNFNWFKSNGLKCSLRPHATLANLQKNSNW